MIEFIDKTETEQGTFIDRGNLMALQGFIGATVSKSADGTITETNAKGETLVTKVEQSGSILTTFTGAKVINKRTTVNPDGTITEVVF